MLAIKGRKQASLSVSFDIEMNTITVSCLIWPLRWLTKDWSQILIGPTGPEPISLACKMCRSKQFAIHLKTSDKPIEQTVIISSRDTFGRDYFNGEQIYWGKIGKRFALYIHTSSFGCWKSTKLPVNLFSKHVFHLEMQMPYLWSFLDNNAVIQQYL